MTNLLMNNYLEYLKGTCGKSEGTIKQYRNDLEIWITFMKDKYFQINKETIKKIDLTHIDSFLSYLTNKGNSAVSRRRKISTLKSFFGYLKRLQLIKYNIMVDVKSPKVKKTIPKYFDIEDCKKLIAIKKGRNVLRNETIIDLFLSTGMRLSELVSLNLECIKKDTLTVIGKGKKPRTIYLTPNMINKLNEYIKIRPQSNDAALFLNEKKTRLQKAGVQAVIREAIKNAGLNQDGKSDVLVHILRHSFASSLIQNDVDIRVIQELLGHEDISTTQIYTHVSNKQTRKAVEENPLNSII